MLTAENTGATTLPLKASINFRDIASATLRDRTICDGAPHRPEDVREAVQSTITYH